MLSCDFQEVLHVAHEEMQLAASSAFLQILRKDLVPIQNYTQTFLQTILSSIDIKDPGELWPLKFSLAEREQTPPQQQESCCWGGFCSLAAGEDFVLLLLGRILFSCCWGGFCSLAAGEELSPYPKDVMLGTNYYLGSHAEVNTYLWIQVSYCP